MNFALKLRTSHDREEKSEKKKTGEKSTKPGIIESEFCALHRRPICHHFSAYRVSQEAKKKKDRTEFSIYLLFHSTGSVRLYFVRVSFVFVVSVNVSILIPYVNRNIIRNLKIVLLNTQHVFIYIGLNSRINHFAVSSDSFSFRD